MSDLKFRADIEGLRGIAVLLVVLYHARVSGFSGGYIGVDVFFVISGYLISRLLVREAVQRGRIDFAGFYARRVRRLLPASLVMVVVTCVALSMILAPMEWRGPLNTALAASLYASNVFLAKSAVNYFGGGGVNPFLHTWSLSVEEQFYFLWPLFVAFALGSGVTKPRRFLVGSMVVLVLSFALNVWLTAYRQPYAFFLVPTRAWEFALGAIAGAEFMVRAVARRPWLVAAAGMVAVILPALVFTESTAFPGVAALVPCMGTALLLAAGAAAPGTAIVKAISTRPFVWVGETSYGWYLWHWPAVVLADVVFPVARWAPVFAVMLSLGVARVSLVSIERPLRSSRWLTTKRSLVTAVTAAVLMTALLFAWRQWAATAPSQLRYALANAPIPGPGAACMSNFGDSAPSYCRIAGRENGPRVWLIGDSHAEHWVPAMQRGAEAFGWNVTISMKGACLLADVDYPIAEFNRRYIECTQWRERIVSELEKERPDLLVIANHFGRVSAEGPVLPADFERGLASFLGRLSASKLVYVNDTPSSTFNPTLCLARNEWLKTTTSCDFSQQSPPAEEIVRRTVANVISLNDSLCFEGRCPPVIDGALVYRDSNHLTAAMSTTLAPRLAQQLQLRIDTHDAEQ